MNKSKQFLCCDWGTSNFRLFLVNSKEFEIIGSIEESNGISRIYKDWQQAKTQSQTDFFRSFLQGKIADLSKQLDLTLNSLDVVLSGMSSSTIGIQEVPYSNLPFDLNTPQLNINCLERSKEYTNRLFIIGGVKSSNDVIRGEEIQVLGIRDFLDFDKSLCILPGTHSKHIFISDGKVTSFQTYMTGEIFSLMCKNSILSSSLLEGDIGFDSKSFQEGVLEGSRNNLLGSLFKVRTNDILKNMAVKANRSFLSGLLIGAEISSIGTFQGSVVLGANKLLGPLYTMALELLHPELKQTYINEETMQKAIPRGQLFLMSTKKEYL